MPSSDAKYLKQLQAQKGPICQRTGMQRADAIKYYIAVVAAEPKAPRKRAAPKKEKSK